MGKSLVILISIIVLLVILIRVVMGVSDIKRNRSSDNEKSNLLGMLDSILSKPRYKKYQGQKLLPVETVCIPLNIQIKYIPVNGKLKATAAVKGGIKPYKYLWNDGTILPYTTVNYDEEGYIIVKDARKCKTRVDFNAPSGI